MGSIGGGIPFPGDGAVELPDPGRVEIPDIDLCGGVVEDRCQDLKAALHQVPRLIVVRKIDAVEQVGPVPGVSHDRIRESLFSKPGPDPLGMSECGGMFFIGR